MLLLDLETTGLNPRKHTIVSIGLMYYDKTYNVIHSFVEKPEDEEACLIKFLEFIEAFKVLVTYNGTQFELPFLLKRCYHYELDTTPLLNLRHIDLKKNLKVFNKKRLELEALFFYTRHCKSAGLDIVKLYQTYQQHPDPLYKECIFAHQKEELGSLMCFTEFYLACIQVHSWQLLSYQINEMSLDVTFKTTFTFKSSFFGMAYQVAFAYLKGTDTLHIIFPLYHGTLYQSLKPTKDYYYIESQNQLVHKSLAQFIEPSLKRRARPSECVLYKESTFLLLLPSFKTTLPIWEGANSQSYIHYRDISQSFLQNYLLHFIFYAFSIGP